MMVQSADRRFDVEVREGPGVESRLCEGFCHWAPSYSSHVQTSAPANEIRVSHEDLKTKWRLITIVSLDES